MSSRVSYTWYIFATCVFAQSTGLSLFNRNRGASPRPHRPWNQTRHRREGPFIPVGQAHGQCVHPSRSTTVLESWHPLNSSVRFSHRHALPGRRPAEAPQRRPPPPRAVHDHPQGRLVLPDKRWTIRRRWAPVGGVVALLPPPLLPRAAAKMGFCRRCSGASTGTLPTHGVASSYTVTMGSRRPCSGAFAGALSAQGRGDSGIGGGCGAVRFFVCLFCFFRLFSCCVAFSALAA